MKASARIELARCDGRDVLVDVRSDPPIAFRRCGDRLLSVGSAAGPVGGDEIDVEIIVGDRSQVSVGSVAATSVWPGPAGELSRTTTKIRLGECASLCWWPEPTVSIAGSNHRSTMRVELAEGARCTIIEEVSLGRFGEPSGTLQIELRVQRGGWPLVHHSERFGPDEPGAGSSIGVAAGRHVLSGIVVGPDVGDAVTAIEPYGQAAWLPVADDASTVLVVAADRPAAHRLLDRVWQLPGRPGGPRVEPGVAQQPVTGLERARP